jgi:hypothetical protein
MKIITSGLVIFLIFLYSMIYMPGETLNGPLIYLIFFSLYNGGSLFFGILPLIGIFLLVVLIVLNATNKNGYSSILLIISFVCQFICLVIDFKEHYTSEFDKPAYVVPVLFCFLFYLAIFCFLRRSLRSLRTVE